MQDLVTLSRAWVQSPYYMEMTSRQIALLGILCDEPGPHHVRVLAKQLNVAKPVITRALNVFAAKGVIQRRRCEHDRRDITISATNGGRTLRQWLRMAA